MITGKNNIGFELSGEGKKTFSAVNPDNFTEIDNSFFSATADEVEQALAKSEVAFEQYRLTTGKDKADVLEKIADELLALGDVLVQRAVKETGLPEARIIGERGRTVGQLKMFAELVRDGSWIEATIDTGIPGREPLPKPDLRKLLVPIGPVVVFGASNFPLAFSTAGGDTASALAGGNTVIVKAHSSHPGTSELVASAIIEAARKTGMPDGVFSHLQDAGFSVGQQLVTASEVKAVTFTGSFKGGKALFDLANTRKEPIPFFAEMGSTNPIILLPGALKDNPSELAKMIAGSITLGSGQFCTNPGLLIGVDNTLLEPFKQCLGEEISAIASSTMLNKRILDNYEQKKSEAIRQNSVISLSNNSDDSENKGTPLVASVESEVFVTNPKLQEEVFGPYSLVVNCSDRTQLDHVVDQLKGQLTVTIMGTPEDLEEFGNQIEKLKNKAGRIIFNGVPTGVEVCPSMQHGGPFPATTDPRFTSVGTSAIRRFVRPLSFQGWPDHLLPAELQESNPLDIWRLYNNEWTKSN